jgi:uncharacterized protein YndB with AHSA1/START domain
MSLSLTQAWWGPPGVDCIEAQVDLRVGGAYRLANRFPDGRVVWISGAFEVVDAPRSLVYTWQLDGQASPPERVTVRFEAQGAVTEVIVLHERISDDTARRGHALGWEGCLARLEEYVRESSP